jgi:serine/threonine protein kinase
LILRTVGKGGMGAVYQAKDLKRHVICAIKEMSLSMVPPEEQPQAIQNFKDEAKILWALNHPNLPTFYGFFSENQRYYLVMEYIDGNTLEGLLEQNRGPFSERRVLGWARQICDVLEYLHSQNPPIIFRDMKPGNTMLTRDGQVKLIDFGIARLFRSSGAQDTQLLGTPGFAPPEQYGTAQTDERSDIYSLAMTLYQLLTDKLPETGFGLRDVREDNPRISLSVARALEKAASMDPDDRYDTIAEFRRALLGPGTFTFDNGDSATGPEELAELCARYPDEASDYIANGEIESWLYEIGETELARTARLIRTMSDDPMHAVDRFLQAILGQHAYVRHPRAQPSTNGAALSRSIRAQQKKAAVPMQVSPPSLQFGEVYPGISGPLVLSISGPHGKRVRGTIHTTEPWILIDQVQFDDALTEINVRINSTSLRAATHYSGSILIAAEGEEAREYMVSVEADVQGYPVQNGWRRRGGKTIGADLDEEDDEEEEIDDDDELIINNVASVSSSTGQSQVFIRQRGTHYANDVHRSKHEEKYGDANDTAGGWEPLQVSARQQLWIQHGQAFIAAMMVGSLCYTLLTSLPPLAKVSLLSPSPWFILILVLLVPATTLGALLINRDEVWDLREKINHACTGMLCSLTLLAVVKFAWQVFPQTRLAPLEMVVMLVMSSLGAAIGTYSFISEYIVFGTSWLLARIRWLAVTIAALLGGLFGFFLTTSIALACFTPFSILIGAGVAVALVLRVDYLMKTTHEA